MPLSYFLILRLYKYKNNFKNSINNLGLAFLSFSNPIFEYLIPSLSGKTFLNFIKKLFNMIIKSF